MRNEEEKCFMPIMCIESLHQEMIMKLLVSEFFNSEVPDNDDRNIIRAIFSNKLGGGVIK